MTTPRHRQQFDAAREPYEARNALGLTTWIAVNTSAPSGGVNKPYYGGGYELKSGTGIAFGVTNNPKQVTINAASAPTISTTPMLVAALPPAASNKGARAFVTDSTTTTFHATVVGGGTNNIGVVCDGTNWYVG